MEPVVDTKKMMKETLENGVVVKTTPQISKEDAKYLERIIYVVKSQGKEGKVSIVVQSKEDIELIERLTRTYLEINQEGFESGGRVVDAHKAKVSFEGEGETIFNLNGISPWLENMELIELLEIGGYQWRK